MKYLRSLRVPALMLGAIVVALGCGASERRPEPARGSVAAVTASVPLPVVASSGAVRHQAPCDAARELATRVLGAANSDSPKLSPFDPEVPISGRCLAAKGGTWAIVLSALDVQTDEGMGRGVTGTFEIFHTDEEGRLVSATPPPQNGMDTNYVDISGSVSMVLHEPVLFDFDGDGSDEIVVYGSGSYHEGESFPFGTVWTFREGAITPYKPAAQIRFDEVKDVTADGRPDLLFHGPFDDVVESACSGFSYRLVGPSFVAHARIDGSFAVDDAEAKAFARIACPAPPKKLVVMDATDPAMMDEAATTANVVCARVWGTSQASLRAKIQAGCKASKARVECDGTPGECAQQATMLDWAGRKPPVSLSR